MGWEHTPGYKPKDLSTSREHTSKYKPKVLCDFIPRGLLCYTQWCVFTPRGVILYPGASCVVPRGMVLYPGSVFLYPKSLGLYPGCVLYKSLGLYLGVCFGIFIKFILQTLRFIPRQVVPCLHPASDIKFEGQVLLTYVVGPTERDGGGKLLPHEGVVLQRRQRGILLKMRGARCGYPRGTW